MSSNHPTARSIFLGAVESHPPQNWDAYLDDACAGNPDLRRRVAALLRAHAEANSLLDAPGSAIVATVEAPSPERIGAVIGPYKLMEQIGEGGMGLVYVAEQHQPVRRKVALKLIKPGMDTRQVIARFEAERQALALMNHPNIAKVFDGGETPSGRPYFVMEFVKGVPITEYCDAHRLTPRARLELFSQVCAAVQHAHQKGIIHRDIKPSNVIVSSHDGTPVVKVIDFGVAKAIGQQLTDKTVYTQVAQFIGTPLYMSPEQAGQSDLDIDTRTDVYALGVLLYELLTGTTPFDKDRLSNASYDEIRRLIREEEPPKPSTRLSTLNNQAGSTVSAQRQSNTRELSLLLRGELDWIVMKSLEKDRNRRYESASALAADVERYLKDEPVQACPPSRRYLIGKFLRRHRTGVRTTAGFLAAVVLFAVGAGWVVQDRVTRQMESDRKRIAIEHAVAKELEEAVRQQKEENWASARQAVVRAMDRLAGTELDALQSKAEQCLRELDLVARLDEAQLKATEASSDDRFDYGASVRAYEQAFADHGLDLAVGTVEESVRRIRASAIRGRLIAALDHWASTKDDWANAGGATVNGESLRAIANHADDDPWRRKLGDSQVAKDRAMLISLAEMESSLSQPPINLLSLTYRLHRAKASAAAVQLVRRAQARYPANFWLASHVAAELLFSNDPEAQAEAAGFYRVAVALRPESPIAHSNLAAALIGQKKLPEAEAACRRAIFLQPNYASAYSNLGNALTRQGKLDEAEAAHREAIRLRPGDAVGYYNLGVTLSDQGKASEAEKAYRKAIELNPKHASSHLNLGVALGKQGKHADAEESIRKAIKFKHDFDLAYSSLGLCLRLQKKLPLAEEACRTAIKLNPKSGVAHDNLGAALGEQGKLAESEVAFRKAIELQGDLASAYNNLAHVLSKQKRLLEIVAAYRNAIDRKLSNYITLDYAASYAALAGRGEWDADKLNAMERAQFRVQALSWMRANLAARQEEFARAPDKEGPELQRRMREWQKDECFNGVRGDEALAKLPADELQEWQKLWADVAKLEQRAAASRSQ